MLNMHCTKQITDVIHGTILCSGLEYEVMATPIFNRLHRILQSSMVYLTFGSNKVKRFEHSVGTMHLAGKLFFHACCNSEAGPIISLLTETENLLVEWRDNLDFEKDSYIHSDLHNDFIGLEISNAPVPDCVLYRCYNPGNIIREHEFSFFVLFESIRLAGMMHDLGHLPYSHIVESSLKILYSRIIHIPEIERSNIQNSFIELLQPYCESDNAIHEEIGKQLVHRVKLNITNNLPHTVDTERFFLAAVFYFTEKILQATPSENTLYSDLHQIIAGVVDVDRLDYCTRDAFCSGINKNIFMYDRLLTTYKIFRKADQLQSNNRMRFRFCIESKNLILIEDLLKRRYEIFSEINYHHRVHKHEILLSEVLATLGEDELTQKSNLDAAKCQNQRLNKASDLPLEVSSIWLLLKELGFSSNAVEYSVIQLDDSWMDTLLKSKFFQKYGSKYHSLSTYGNDSNWNSFDELISTERHYCSLYKRLNEFRSFDERLYGKMLDAHTQGAFDMLSEPYRSKISSLFNAANYGECKKNISSFLYNHIIGLLSSGTSSVQNELLRNVEQTIQGKLKKNQYASCNIIDCLIRSCQFSLGYDIESTPVYLYDKDNTLLDLRPFSNQYNEFIAKRKNSPAFHIYFLPRFDTNHMLTSVPDIGQFNLLIVESFAEVLTSAICRRFAGKSETVNDGN